MGNEMTLIQLIGITALCLIFIIAVGGAGARGQRREKQRQMKVWADAYRALRDHNGA